MKNYRTLYHISRSGHFPGPKPVNYGDHQGQIGVFFTTNPISVFCNQFSGPAEMFPVHAFKISEEIIQKSGGMKVIDNAPELFVDKFDFEEGIASKNIVYLGKVNENKIYKKVREAEKTYIRNWTMLEELGDKPKDKIASIYDFANKFYNVIH